MPNNPECHHSATAIGPFRPCRLTGTERKEAVDGQMVCGPLLSKTRKQYRCLCYHSIVFSLCSHALCCVCVFHTVFRVLSIFIRIYLFSFVKAVVVRDVAIAPPLFFCFPITASLLSPRRLQPLEIKQKDGKPSVKRC